jgi:hypothetical protein
VSFAPRDQFHADEVVTIGWRVLVDGDDVRMFSEEARELSA